MRTIKWMLLSVVLVWCASLSVSAEDKIAATSLTIEQWDMQALPADWWRALQIKDATQLKTNLDQLQNKILAVRANLTSEQQSDTANITDSIVTSAKAYLDLASKTTQSSVKSVAVEESYSLLVWLDAMRDLRKANLAVSSLNERASQISDQLGAIAKEADNSAAAYLVASNEVKTVAVLNMIERRLAWFVANESLRLQHANAEGAQVQLSQADTYWHLATERLTLSDKDTKSLQAQREHDRLWQEKSTDTLRRAQADAVLVWGDDEASRAKSELQQIITLQAAIDQALAQAKNQWDERLLSYIQLRSDKQFDWDAGLRNFIPHWQAERDKLDQQRKNWRTQLENRREQVQSALLVLVENPPELLNTKQLSLIKQNYLQAIKTLADSQSALKSLYAQLEDMETLAGLQEKALLAHDGVLGNRWHNTTQAFWVVGEDIWALMSATFFKVGDTPVTVLGLVRVVLFITIAWWLSFWLRKALVKIASGNEKIASHTAYTLGRLIHYLIMIVGTIVALSSIGIDFSNVAWIAGALSVGIGFGLQDMVKNFVSGLVVMFEKTLKVGDYIELPSGLSGKVKEISLRSTLITTADNLEVVIPNTEFTSGRVVNWTLSDLYRRVHIPFNVALNSDKKQVVAAVLNAASQVPYTIKEGSRAPQVVLGSLDGKMAFELLVWIKQGAVQYEYGVKASYLWQIETALREHEIVLV